MQKILADPQTYPLFSSNADNATVIFTGSDPYRNNFADTNEGDFTSSGRKLTQQLIKMMVVPENEKQVYQDPRLAIIGKKNPSVTSNPANIWIGTVAGVSVEKQNQADKGTSWLNAAVFCRPDASGYFLEYSELQFILAEAALKGLIAGGEATAKNYYEAAVRASLQKWAPLGAYSATPVTISDEDIALFLTSDLAAWDKHENKEELIANQKFLSLFWIGMEAYHEYRRTGYPVLTIGDGAIYNDFILPTRFAYSTTTMATNNAHANEAIQRMGGSNDMKMPVWWSKQAIDR